MQKKMNEREFAELIERCISGQATEEEVALVEEWLYQRTSEDPFGKLSAEEREEIRVQMLRDLSSGMRQSRQTMSEEKSGKKRVVFYKVAAAILVLSLLTYSTLQLTEERLREEIKTIQAVAATGASKKVILSDSSIVWLKGASSILYPEKFSGNARNVKLIGEALFEVAKDPNNPFVIQCGGLTAKVLGTSFNIKGGDADIEVLVLTGKVALTSKGNDNELILLPNEKAVYNESQNAIVKVEAEENEGVVKTQGTQYSMKFNATPLLEIIQRIEGKFDVRVSLSDERLNNCKITADFTDQSLDRTLSMIAQTLKIEYEIRRREVTLKGAGCD